MNEDEKLTIVFHPGICHNYTYLPVFNFYQQGALFMKENITSMIDSSGFFSFLFFFFFTKNHKNNNPNILPELRKLPVKSLRGLLTIYHRKKKKNTMGKKMKQSSILFYIIPNSWLIGDASHLKLPEKTACMDFNLDTMPISSSSRVEHKECKKCNILKSRIFFFKPLFDAELCPRNAKEKKYKLKCIVVNYFSFHVTLG